MFSDQDRLFMNLAIAEAKISYSKNEVPVGAIIVRNNEVIGKGYNSVIRNKDVSSHAEIVAIKNASKFIGNYRLCDTTMYTTLEPCHMCAKAIVDARINQIIFAAAEPKTGSIISIDNLYDRQTFNHKVLYRHGLLEHESSELLKDFFKSKR